MASLSSVVELLEDRIDTTTAIGVHFGTRLALAIALSHLLELGTEIELHGSGHNADPTEDLVDALWTQTHLASDSLASYVPLSISHGPPDGAGVEQFVSFFSFALM
jgi:hypothetical protein